MAPPLGTNEVAQVVEPPKVPARSRVCWSDVRSPPARSRPVGMEAPGFREALLRGISPLGLGCIVACVTRTAAESIRELEAHTSQLAKDKEALTGRLLDAELIGQVSERLLSVSRPEEAVQAGLERLTALLQLEACLAGELTPAGLEIRFASLARGGALSGGRLVPLDPRVRNEIGLGPVLLDETEARRLGPWPEPLASQGPAAVLIVSAPSTLLPRGAFVFLDTASGTRLRSAIPFLQRAIGAIGARIDNLSLLSDFQQLNESLRAGIEQRTRALQESERRLRRLEVMASESRDPIIFVRATDGLILDANAAAIQLYGYTLADLRDMTVSALRAPSERETTSQDLARVTEWGILFSTLHQRRDGSTIPVEVSARAAEVDGVRTIVSVVRDVSERRAAEEALRRSEERFRTAFATSPDSININRLADGVFVAINQGFTRLTGWAEADVLGRSSLELGIWPDPGDRQRLIEGLQARGFVENLESDFRLKDGRVGVGLMSARVLELGGVVHILSVTRDITGMRRAEQERDRMAEQLRQAQKLEAIGQLAGGVAHDFNNLLTVILGSVSMFRADLAAGQAPQADDVEQIEQAGLRARDLTRQLLAFARKQPVSRTIVDLNRVVGGSEKLLRRVLGEFVALDVSLDPGLGCITADVGQLEQVVLNLAVNARDAMPDGGVLSISTRNLEAGAGSGPGQVPPLAGAEVGLVVRDTGVGMTPEVKARIFEPFFTTKGIGEGTGLGLATVYGIVTQWGGSIKVDSAPGAGTTFEIRFPRTEQGSPTPDPEPPPGLVRGAGTIVVVEDEPAVRRVVARALEGGGYRVLTAAGGEEALRVLEAEARPADLLVTDLILPGMSGRALAEAARARNAVARVLFVSGYAKEPLRGRSELDAGMELLPKPFTADVLLARVRDLLERPGHGNA
jgi:PAS domain S-box-containing protein